jgi:hypothetical protein
MRRPAGCLAKSRAIAAAMTVLCAAHVATRSEAQEPFEPELFERTVAIELKGGPDQVFAYFEPDRRIEAYGARVLAAGETADSSGMVFWKDHGDMHQYWVVGEHEPGDRLVRYVYLEGDYELLVEEIRVEGSDDVSVATITWKVWGLRQGSGVREYMTSGRFDDRMKRLQESINTRLEEVSSPAP